MATPDLSDEMFVLDIPMYAYNALYRNGVRTVGQVIELTAEDVIRMRCIGPKRLGEIEAALAVHGLALATVAAPRPSPIRARLAAAGVVAAGAPQTLTAPPEPGLERARWIGDRVTTLIRGTSKKLSPHARRRAAARRALAQIDGYVPTRAEDDALYHSSASLQLAGLNELARRVLDEGETDGLL